MSIYSIMRRPGRSLLADPLTNNKNLQEACYRDNQLNNKRIAVDTAALRRSVDTNTYISSQENSRHEHPQHCVEAKKISDSQPSSEARSLPRQVKIGLHVWTGRHGVSMLVKSVEPVYFMFYPTMQQTTENATSSGYILSNNDTDHRDHSKYFI